MQQAGAAGGSRSHWLAFSYLPSRLLCPLARLPAQVNMATQNLFIRCREKSKLQHKLVANPLAQLTMIGDFMQDLGSIVKSWQRIQAERAAGGRAGQRDA